MCDRSAPPLPLLPPWEIRMCETVYVRSSSFHCRQESRLMCEIFRDWCWVSFSIQHGRTDVCCEVRWYLRIKGRIRKVSVLLLRMCCRLLWYVSSYRTVGICGHTIAWIHIIYPTSCGQACRLPRQTLLSLATETSLDWPSQFSFVNFVSVLSFSLSFPGPVTVKVLAC